MLLVAVALASCGGGSGSTPTPATPVVVTPTDPLTGDATLLSPKAGYMTILGTTLDVQATPYKSGSTLQVSINGVLTALSSTGASTIKLPDNTGSYTLALKETTAD